VQFQIGDFFFYPISRVTINKHLKEEEIWEMQSQLVLVSMQLLAEELAEVSTGTSISFT
jgi:hypothetical protein